MRTRQASPRFYRSLPVPVKLAAVTQLAVAPAGHTDPGTLPHGLAKGPDISSNDARPNGDEVVDVRMAKIEEILGHAAMRLLDKCGLVAE